MKKTLLVFLLLITSLAAPSFAAEDVYQSKEDFITESFEGSEPNQKKLESNDILLQKIKRIMGDHYKLTTISYWENNGKTAWILEEIGKYKPITTGFVIGEEGKIERVKVLIYRESHGWEVKHKFFTNQFKGAGLKKEKKLDKRVDGISGATLSVDALKKLSALALLLHHHVKSAT